MNKNITCKLFPKTQVLFLTMKTMGHMKGKMAQQNQEKTIYMNNQISNQKFYTEALFANTKNFQDKETQ